MYFFIEKEKIVNILNKFNKYTNNSCKNPILNNVLLILKNLKLKLIITNLDIEISFIIYLNFDSSFKNGSVTVNINKLYELCKSFPKKHNIYFFLFFNRLKISCLKSKSLLSTLPVIDFPIIDKNIYFNYNFSISSIYLKKIIYYIHFSMGLEDIYYYLNSMLIEYKKNKLYFVTTDSYRISIYKLLNNFTYKFKKYFSLVISRNLVIELFKLLNFINDIKINFYISNNIIKLIFDNFIIYSNIMEGSFPDYNSFLINDNKYIYFDIFILDIKNALIRSSIISGSIFNYVTFFLKKNYLFIYSSDSNNNEIKEKIFINYKGKKFKISFNIKYILDIIKTMSNDNKVRFFLKDSDSVIKIINLNNKFIYYMVMPIQL